MVVFRRRGWKGGTTLQSLHHSALDIRSGEFVQQLTQVLRVWVRPPCRTILGVPALIGLGLTHRTAPLAVRERLALSPEQASRLVAALVASGTVDEAVALSTCNRTELYLVGEDAVAAERAALAALARHAGTSPAALALRLTAVRGGEVAEHLFAVAAGLDSMVLGEAEILGQLRRAHELSRAAGACGPFLDRLLRDALGAGRRVRSGTAIGRCGVSVSSAAVELAREALGSVAGRRVMLVGAGKSSETTAKVLRKHGVAALVVSNRGRERALELARRHGGEVASGDIETELAGCDLVLSATACPQVLIGRDAVERAMARRDGRPLVIVDLAVPRDVDPDVRAVPGVTLIDLDDVERRVARNRESRAAGMGAAETIVADEAERFERWRAAREAAPTVAALQGAGEAIVAELLERNEAHWESMSDADRERVASLARAVARRLLHEPTLRVKQGAQDGDEAPLRAARELFGLDPAADVPVARRA
jgi:glutamyl-tRNA reductase